MHDLDAGQDDASTPEILETHHWFDDAFDGAVILLHDAIRYLFWRTLIGVERSALSASSAARLAPLLSTVIVSGSPFCSIAFSMGAQQEIHRVARLVDGTVQVLPLVLVII
ncbi:hypothetical protein LMG29542_08121 [Paraburkholderia humisilvae]|uniref:Uncharacterized protein n=1 Tax=Paraburkholderia humisilvae TaxID=627669 RepID=A0A6J5F8P6_9BURK|nr:hypothetical protein LMG29542_08121 [Paraburkholderia humisilvae]